MFRRYAAQATEQRANFEAALAHEREISAARDALAAQEWEARMQRNGGGVIPRPVD